MSLSSRYFIFYNDELIKVSQRKFNDFYFAKKPVFEEFSGEVIKMINIVVELKNRKPYRIVRSHFLQHKIDKSGAIDQEYERGYAGLASYMLNEPKTKTTNGLVDASQVFEEKALRNKHAWQPSENVERMAYEQVFKC